jgi:hypothetical protein
MFRAVDSAKKKKVEKQTGTKGWRIILKHLETAILGKSCEQGQLQNEQPICQMWGPCLKMKNFKMATAKH